LLIYFALSNQINFLQIVLNLTVASSVQSTDLREPDLADDTPRAVRKWDEPMSEAGNATRPQSTTSRRNIKI